MDYVCQGQFQKAMTAATRPMGVRSQAQIPLSQPMVTSPEVRESDNPKLARESLGKLNRRVNRLREGLLIGHTHQRQRKDPALDTN